MNASLHDHHQHENIVFISAFFHVPPFSYQTFNILQLTDASEEIPHYVIAKATYGRQMLPVFCSVSALPEKFPLHELLLETPAQQRPLRAVMQQHIPKKPWSHRGTGAAVGFLDGKRGCCLICLDINAGKSCASALLLQLLEAAKQWRSDLNLLCHSGWNEFPDQVAAN